MSSQKLKVSQGSMVSHQAWKTIQSKIGETLKSRANAGDDGFYGDGFSEFFSPMRACAREETLNQPES